MAGHERDHTARHRGDLLHGGIGTQRVAGGDTAWPHVRSGRPGPAGRRSAAAARRRRETAARGARCPAATASRERSAVRPAPPATRNRGARGDAGGWTRPGPDGQRYRAAISATASARDQPPTDRIAAIGITATADNVEGRPVRHQLNVSAAHRRREQSRCGRGTRDRRTRLMSAAFPGPARASSPPALPPPGGRAARMALRTFAVRRDEPVAAAARHVPYLRAEGFRHGRTRTAGRSFPGAPDKQQKWSDRRPRRGGLRSPRRSGAAKARRWPGAIRRWPGSAAISPRCSEPCTRPPARRLGGDLSLLRECRAHARETGWALRLLHCHLAGDGARGWPQARERARLAGALPGRIPDRGARPGGLDGGTADAPGSVSSWPSATAPRSPGRPPARTRAGRTPAGPAGWRSGSTRSGTECSTPSTHGRRHPPGLSQRRRRRPPRGRVTPWRAR